MILALLILIPVAAGLIAWAVESRGVPGIEAEMGDAPRWVALGALALDLLLALMLWAQHTAAWQLSATGPWLVQAAWDWIPRFGIRAQLGMDGLSLLLILLTCFLGMMAVFSSWTEIRERVGFFHFNLLWTLAGVIGVFLALDLFLFFFLWELMLVPMYFLIALWGHEGRVRAAIKFFLFTQGSGLLMLVAILALFFVHHASTGQYTFSYFELLGTSMTPEVGRWVMLGFFVAFAVKLPAIPLHTWLPDAHTEAPTGGSVILAGILLKTGAYGMLRFVLPLFPAAAAELAPAAMVLGAVGVLYGAVLAFAQTDLKRLVAYTSVSHMGFVLLGIFAWNTLALQGAVIEMLAHGISTGALFILAGAVQERLHTRDMRRMGGLWSTMPRMAAIALFFAVASLGLPGLGNFVGEFLVLLGSYQVSIPVTAFAATGLVAAVVYSLAIVHRAFMGERRSALRLPDLSTRETAVLGAMVAVLAWLGLYPQPALDAARPGIERLQKMASGLAATAGVQNAALIAGTGGATAGTVGRTGREVRGQETGGQRSMRVAAAGGDRWLCTADMASSATPSRTSSGPSFRSNSQSNAGSNSGSISGQWRTRGDRHRPGRGAQTRCTGL